MLNCNKITKDTKDIMFGLMRDTVKDSRERGIYLCEDENKNIVSSNSCTGSSCLLPKEEQSKLNCPINTKMIGNFHTHKSAININNVNNDDINNPASMRLQSFCIGYATKTIKCYNIKNEKILRLGNEAQNLALIGKIEDAQKILIKMDNTLIRLKRSSEHYLQDLLDTACVLTRKLNKDKI